MRVAYQAGTRGWLLLPAAIVVLSGLAAGCSSTPAYCTDASQLKTDVQNLGNVDVATNGLSSLQTAITSANGQPSATAAAAVASSVIQVKNSASSLQNAISSSC